VSHYQCHPLCLQSQASHRLHHPSRPANRQTCLGDAIRVKWSVIYAILCTKKSKLSKFSQGRCCQTYLLSPCLLDLSSERCPRAKSGERCKSNMRANDNETMKQWNTTKCSEPPRGISNKQQWTSQLILTLWREAATECGSGPSKFTIVDILDVAEVVENGTVGSFAKNIGSVKWKRS
jgi:hypothetical protein